MLLEASGGFCSWMLLEVSGGFGRLLELAPLLEAKLLDLHALAASPMLGKQVGWARLPHQPIYQAPEQRQRREHCPAYLFTKHLTGANALTSPRHIPNR